MKNETAEGYKGVWSFETDEVENWAYADGAFSEEECEKIIEIGEQGSLVVAGITGGKETNKINQIRDSSVSWLYPNKNMEWVYRRVTDIVTSLNNSYFKFKLFGLGEGFQFTRYDSPDGHYKAHIDKSYGRTVRKLSVTIQLTKPENYEGGELLLYLDSAPTVIPKEQGKLVCFPSYVLHEVAPVTKGTRHSLVAWVTGDQFR